MISPGLVASDPKNRYYLGSLVIAATLLACAFFTGTTFLANDYKLKISRWGVNSDLQDSKSDACKSRCRAHGSEALPEGIVVTTSDFETYPLWGSTPEEGQDNKVHPTNLLAIPVGIKQKETVDRIVKKFFSSEFAVMLFHYDGVVDEWRDLAWSNHAIHVSAMNQTKWWFAKRFLHPDIVAQYDYIFLWDEDLGLDNFDPKRYVAIVKAEGLEISQPALDPAKSKVHQPFTVRISGSTVHRRYYSYKGNCQKNSPAPPCTGWVEMMAPVFSRAAWRCAWFMIQNDLIHAWGLDRQFGYCAQGDRTKNVGVVDSEYVVHLGLPTLGASNGNQLINGAIAPSPSSQRDDFTNSDAPAPSYSTKADNRVEVRMRAFSEMQVFKQRWNDAVKKDKCWVDPYQ